MTNIVQYFSEIILLLDGGTFGLFHSNQWRLCKKVKILFSKNRFSPVVYTDAFCKIIYNAAMNNCPEAQFYMTGDYWNNGFKDLALEWYSIAALNNHEAAIYTLAEVYRLGKSVLRDYEKAFSLYLQLALKGHSLSEHQLGVMCYYGYGCPQDKKKAAYWIGKAYDENINAQNFWDDHELWKHE